MKIVWKIQIYLLSILSIFYIVLSLPGCGYSESYVEQEKAASYSSGYDEGYSDGYDDGYDEAHSDQDSRQSNASNVTSGSQPVTGTKAEPFVYQRVRLFP